LSRIFRRKLDRDGVAAIETAIVMPFVIAVLMGIVEFGWLFYVETTMADVARAVTRDVSVGSITKANADTEVLSRLSNYGYNFAVTVTEINNDVTIDISIPMTDAALINFLGVLSGNIDTTVTMRKEP
jgi:Flp pilus assembly protein TadG